MKKDELAIFLSGSLKKGISDNRPDDIFWTEEKEQLIINGITGIKVSLHNPSKFIIQRNDYYANLGCDLYFITQSDIVLVDIREKKGIGIGAEMMFSQAQGVPVISICPSNSFYRKDFVPDVFGENLRDWIHPFVYGLSDHIVDNLLDAIAVINTMIENGIHRKEPNNMNRAIEYYKNKQ